MLEASVGAGLDSRHIDRTNRPIDLVHLARQTLGDRGLEREVLRMFDHQIIAYFEKLRATDDEYEITLGLHTLKGASRGIGAMPLAALAEAAEAEFMQTGQLDRETLDDLAMAVTEVSAYISSLLDS